VSAHDWNAAVYHRVSHPMHAWGVEVLDRLDLRGDETVLDAGCGTGRVTHDLIERLPHGRVLACDAAPSMVERARETVPDAEVFECDLLDLALEQPVDVIFSTAVFHWVPDHDRLFARLHAALVPGGRLVAQCGGHGNIQGLLKAAEAVGARDPYAAHLAGWSGPWIFATAGEAKARLEGAGFRDVRTWLERKDVQLDEPAPYITTVNLRSHLDRLPEELREPYVDDVLAETGEPLTIEYVRLNIEATR
jgi:trans-aconitate 2-methyltransferase